MIDEYCHPISEDETLTAGRQRRSRWRKEISLSVAFSSFSYRIGASHPTIFVVWRIPDLPQARDATLELRTEAQALKMLPHFLNRQFWRSVKAEFGHAFTGSLPAGGLRYLIKKVTNDASASGDEDLDERIMAYCLSNGDPELYPDLRAANSGRTRGFTEFFEVALIVVDEITGASPYRHGEARVVQPGPNKKLI